MTAVEHRVDARAVTLEGLALLEARTTVTWQGLTAVHGHTWSPSAGDPHPDFLVTADPSGDGTVRVTDVYDPFDVQCVEGEGSLEALLDRIASSSTVEEPVCRFSTSMEISGGDVDTEAPCVALWTGDVWASTAIAASGLVPAMQRGRISHRDLLTRRVNSVEAASTDPHELLLVQQRFFDDTWTITSGAHLPWVVQDSAGGFGTLVDVIDWAAGYLTETAGGAPQPLRQFAVSSPAPGSLMTVRLW